MSRPFADPVILYCFAREKLCGAELPTSMCLDPESVRELSAVPRSIIETTIRASDGEF